MTKLQKNEVVGLIQKEILNLGSANKVAKKCNVSPALISQMVNENWGLIKKDKWIQVGDSLGYEPEGWQIVETLNYKFISTVLRDAKEKSLFMAVSHKAGSGKTATVRHYLSTNSEDNFYLQCREWGKRDFLYKLTRTLGLGDYNSISIDSMTTQVVRFFNSRFDRNPLLVVDEVDKLKPQALRFFITLFNECEDQLGLVIFGTENLEVEIKKGVRLRKKGFDEIDSRFGRNFIHLRGASLKDVEAICLANGIMDKGRVKEIFNECDPTITNLNNQTMKVVEDLRRLKRIVIREQLRMKPLN